MAPHSSILAWKIPWTEKPGRLQSMGLQRVRQDWETSLSLFTFMHWRRKWQATPVFLPGESQGQRSLVGCRLRGRTESDTTEQLHCHFSLSCIGEGKGNPLQCSCLENPRDGGVWWAAVYGVAQSQTQLKGLSSSSSRQHIKKQRHYFVHKGLSSQGYGFSSSHIKVKKKTVDYSHQYLSLAPICSKYHHLYVKIFMR